VPELFLVEELFDPESDFLLRAEEVDAFAVRLAAAVVPDLDLLAVVPLLFLAVVVLFLAELPLLFLAVVLLELLLFGEELFELLLLEEDELALLLGEELLEELLLEEDDDDLLLVEDDPLFEDELFAELDLLPDDLELLLFDSAFLGALSPSARASESPIAMACLRLVTFLPLPPLFSLPCCISCIALCTFSPAALLYFAMVLSLVLSW
jgi:hypothetical protein